MTQKLTILTHLCVVCSHLLYGVVKSEKYLVLCRNDDDLSVRKGFIVTAISDPHLKCEESGHVIGRLEICHDPEIVDIWSKKYGEIDNFAHTFSELLEHPHHWEWQKRGPPDFPEMDD